MIRVLVVDDSPSARQLLVRLFTSDSTFTVAGTAASGEEAVAMAARLQPDVITMDVRMPGIDGIEATRRIMAARPTPIVIISGDILDGDRRPVFEALRAGAATVLNKPHGPGHPMHELDIRELLTTVRVLSGVKLTRGTANARPAAGVPAPRSTPTHTTGGIARAPAAGNGRPQLIALAASTGGPQAIQALLTGLGAVDVPILGVQHMTTGFMTGMIDWLNSTCPQTVKLAQHGEQPAGATVYFGPEESHLLISRQGSIVLSKAPPVGGFRPSANLLFESVAESFGRRAVGVILTGMGSDGAAGLARMRAAGATTIAQDEQSCVVYGMPAAAMAGGAATDVLSLPMIAPALRRMLGAGFTTG